MDDLSVDDGPKITGKRTKFTKARQQDTRHNQKMPEFDLDGGFDRGIDKGEDKVGAFATLRNTFNSIARDFTINDKINSSGGANTLHKERKAVKKHLRQAFRNFEIPGKQKDKDKDKEGDGSKLYQSNVSQIKQFKYKQDQQDSQVKYDMTFKNKNQGGN